MSKTTINFSQENWPQCWVINPEISWKK